MAFLFTVPPVLAVALTSLIAFGIVIGIGWLYFGWFAPNAAPNHRTQFLIDTADGGVPDDLAAVTSSLRKTVENASDGDALSLRRFGGECGAPDNTAQLVGFGIGNQQKITQAAADIQPTGRPTLLRGIVQAVEDFSQRFDTKARQANGLIVVTRHGADACDSDTAFVEKEIRDRVSAAGLSLRFRLIGYRVPDAQRASLDRIAVAAQAPPPVYARNAAELHEALNWYTNTEPVVDGGRAIVRVLNPGVDRVNSAAQAIDHGRFDAAERDLDQARSSAAAAGPVIDDLAARGGSAPARDIHSRASRLRDQQQRLVAAADDLLRAARSGAPREAADAAFRRQADAYNDDVNALNAALDRLRATSPETR